MNDSKGAFYSAEDADVEGEEGKFYLWTEKEIKNIFSKDESDLAIKMFNIQRDGNFEEESTQRKTGKNILYLEKPLAIISSDLKIQIQEIQIDLDNIRKKLFNARKKCLHPHKDDKILIDWNGLMIVALTKAAKVFNEKKYAAIAEKAVNFILTNMVDSNKRLFHRYRDGETAIPSFIDDYAFFVWGLIELYEYTFNTKYLKWAIDLTEDSIKLFWDKELGGFYFTAKSSEETLFRNKEFYDGAYPSGNSVATLNLLRLSRMSEKIEYEKKAS